MLTAFRNFAKSWVAAILMGLLIVSFVGWGAQKYGFSAIRGDEVVKAGSRVIDSQRFRREYDNSRKTLEQRMQQEITPEMAAQNHLDRLVLTQVATREALFEMLERMGIRVSDKLVIDQIHEIPDFFDPVTGRFDENTFRRVLGENSATPAMFDRQVRDENAARFFFTGIANGLRPPRSYGALAAVFMLENRDVAFMSVTEQSVPAPPAPTDAQLTAFMQQRPQAWTRPEMRQLTLVKFVPPAADAVGPVDPAELQKQYDFRKDTLSSPERRTIIQIPAKTAQAAQAITARLAKGEAPATVAKAMGVEANTFQDKPQTAIPDKKLAQAAFQLQAGQVATVQGDLGAAVVKIVSVSPGHQITLEEARPMLEAEIRKTMATAKVYTQTEAYEDAHGAGASLADAAQKAGGVVETLGPLSAQGVGMDRKPVAGVNPRVLEEAFGLPAGGESDLVEAGDGSYFAVRVDKVLPQALLPLTEVRAEVAREWTRQELARRMEARANELTARVQKGESIDAVAASAGLKVTRLAAISRQSAQGDQATPREVLGRAFVAKAGEVFSTPTSAFTYAIGKVENVRMDASPIAAQVAESQRTQMAQELVQEVLQASQNAARKKLKVRIDPARARAAAGMEPEEAAATPGKKK